MEWLYQYETYFTIRINDRRIGLFYNILVLGIILWSFWAIIMEKGYLEYDTPSGSMEFELHQNGSIHLLSQGEEPVEISPITTSKKYCHDVPDTRCRIYDEDEIVEKVSSKGIFITTHVTEILEKRSCLEFEAVQGEVLSCNTVWEEKSSNDYYVADVEKFLIKLQHSMKASQFFEDSGYDPYYAQSNDDMNGALLMKEKGKTTRALKRFPIGKLDVLSIDDILYAAGHSKGLDSPSVNEFGNTTSPQTLRDEGVQLQMELRYTNTLCKTGWSCLFGVSNVIYGYFFTTIPHADFKVIDIEPIDKKTRVKVVRRGILIQAIQAGKIGKFSLQVLIINICSALGLSALATTLVDALGTFVIPRRNLFNDVKFKDVYLDETLIPKKEEDEDKKEKAKKE